MSRSRKGKKLPGYDFWGKRPFSGRGYGKVLKMLCKRVERAKSKVNVRKMVDLPKQESF